LSALSTTFIETNIRANRAANPQSDISTIFTTNGAAYRHSNGGTKFCTYNAAICAAINPTIIDSNESALLSADK
jgi:hypothetical protein